MYDSASTIMAQKLSQISGVGQVVVGGDSTAGTTSTFDVVRLTPTGGFDGLFGIGGVAHFGVTPGNTDVLSGLDTDAADNVFVAGG